MKVPLAVPWEKRPPFSTSLVDNGVRNAGAGCGHDWDNGG
jgi:hypothetical protein